MSCPSPTRSSGFATPTLLAPLLTVVPLQVFACELATARGLTTSTSREISPSPSPSRRAAAGEHHRRRHRRGRHRALRQTLARTPRLRERLFTEGSSGSAALAGRPVRREGGPGEGDGRSGLVCTGPMSRSSTRGDDGRPLVRRPRLGPGRGHGVGYRAPAPLLSHDAGVASAVVIAGRLTHDRGVCRPGRPSLGSPGHRRPRRRLARRWGGPHAALPTPWPRSPRTASERAWWPARRRPGRRRQQRRGRLFALARLARYGYRASPSPLADAGS